jgi:hypothetical protein
MLATGPLTPSGDGVSAGYDYQCSALLVGTAAAFRGRVCQGSRPGRAQGDTLDS